MSSLHTADVVYYSQHCMDPLLLQNQLSETAGDYFINIPNMTLTTKMTKTLKKKQTNKQTAKENNE